jgi:hypothetical protein
MFLAKAKGVTKLEILALYKDSMHDIKTRHFLLLSKLDMPAVDIINSTTTSFRHCNHAMGLKF